MTTTPSPRVRRARRVGFAVWAALFLLQLAWHGTQNAPTEGSRGAVLALALLPLALPLLALRKPGRALLLAGMVALLYFCHGISDAWSVPATRAWACVEIALSLLLILAVGAAVERRPRRNMESPAS
jgi:uncharacterized membrane protein